MSPSSELEDDEEFEYEEIEEEVEVDEVEEEEEEPQDVEEIEEDEESEYEEIEEEVEVEDDEQQQEEIPTKKPTPNFQNPNPNPIFQTSIANLQSLHSAISDFLLHFSTLHQTLSSLSSSLQNPNPKPAADPNDLDSICRYNNSKSLRRYVTAHLSDPARLRAVVPTALKLSPGPEKLVLDAVGKFYIQGRKAFDRPNSQLAEVRRAGVLILELYLVAGCPVGEDASKVEVVRRNANEAAVAWRGRMVSEGGVEGASREDALGLLLLVAGFGVPEEFRARDFLELVRVSRLGTKRELLRRSNAAERRISDIIKDLIKKEMHIEAVKLVCAFGLEEKFPPLPLLSSFVKKACELGVQQRSEGSFSFRSLKEANEKELAALKSVAKCLEDHKLDGHELAGFSISQKIAKLEKEISRKDQHLQHKNTKRKAEDVEPSKNQEVQAKQVRSYLAEASHGAPQSTRTQERSSPAFPDSRHIYNGFIASDLSIPKQASPGLVERRSPMGSVPGNAHEPAGGGLHVNVAEHQRSVRQSLLAQFYSSIAGQNYYQPGATSHGTEGRNPYQFADGLSEREVQNFSNSTTGNAAPSAVAVTGSGHKIYYANPDHQSSYTSSVRQSSYYTNSGSESAYTNQGNEPAYTSQGYHSTYTSQGQQSAYTNQGQQPACANQVGQSTFADQGHQLYTNLDHQAYYTNQAHQSAYTNSADQSAYTNPADQSYCTSQGQQSAYSNPGQQSSYINEGSQSSYVNPGHQVAFTNPGNQSSYTDQAHQLAYSSANQQVSHTDQGYPTAYTNPEQQYHGHQLVYAIPDQQASYNNQAHQSANTKPGNRSAYTGQSQQLVYRNPDQQMMHTNPDQQSLNTNQGQQPANTIPGSQSSYTDQGQQPAATNVGNQPVNAEHGHQLSSAIPDHQGDAMVAS